MDITWMILAAVCTYILASIFFLKCPILYRRKWLTFRCAHISHRGGSAERLENTLEAFKNAEVCGTHMLELDVHLTADKVVVVSHDDHLIRTTGENVCIKDTCYKDLPPLLNSIPVVEGVTCQRSGNSLKIPTLEDVFEEFPEMPIHIDIKVNNDELIRETNHLIKQYKREHITPCGSFSSEVCTKLNKENPSIPLSFCQSRVIFIIAAFWLGFLPFVPIKESCFAIPMGRAVRKGLSPSYLKSMKVRIYLFFMDFLLLSSAMIKHLSDRGIHVYLWVVNDEEDFRKAFALGATGVMTDYPKRLQKWLNANDK